MELIKIDNTRKQIKLKERVSFGKTKVVKGKLLSDINYTKFDKHIAEYANYKGMTYVFATNIPNVNEDEQTIIKSKVQVDEDLKRRYMKGQSEDYKIELQEIKEEFGL